MKPLVSHACIWTNSVVLYRFAPRGSFQRSSLTWVTLYEPSREKNCLQCFRTGFLMTWIICHSFIIFWMHYSMVLLFSLKEPRHEKTGFLHMLKKDADQLCGNHEADQHLCFRYTDSAIPLLPKPEISSL